MKIILPLLGLFLGYYVLFYLFFNPIHYFYPPVDLSNIIWWHQQFIFRDGIELKLMFVGSLIYLFGAYLLVKKRQKIYLSRLALSKPPRLSLKLPSALVLLFGMIIFLGMDVPSIYDYGYFLGPALKIGQGEPLKSFFMQYSLLGVLIFKVMEDLGMKIWQMQATLVAVFTIWLFLYLVLISRFIKDQLLITLFLFSLFLFRYLFIYHDPIRVPAVLPFRLDLWVPLFLGAYKFGLLSPLTSLGFVLIYVLDNTFGPLFLVVYLIFAAEELYRQWQAGGIKILTEAIWVKRIGLIGIFIIAGSIFQLVNFGSLTSPAIKIYQQIQLGFMPIDRLSPFWLIWLVLPFVVWMFSLEKVPTVRRLYFFLLGLFSVQMVYFYGRSHDNNLLNLAGIWLTIFFLAINQFLRIFTKLKVKIVVGLICLLIITTTLLGRYGQEKLDRINDKISKGVLIEESQFEKSIERAPLFFAEFPNKDKVFVLSQFDAYINYRYGLAQIGFFTPFPMHVFVDKTTDYFVDLIKNKYYLVLWEDEMTALIEQLNNSEYAKKRGIFFGLNNLGNKYQVELVESATSSAGIKYPLNKWLR